MIKIRVYERSFTTWLYDSFLNHGKINIRDEA